MITCPRTEDNEQARVELIASGTGKLKDLITIHSRPDPCSPAYAPIRIS